MKQAKIAIKNLILIIVLVSVLIMFFATPVSNAELDLEEDEFYYSGSTEGTYKPGTNNIFRWLLKALGDIADYILGILTMGIRMVFVGWTALLERALTWAVETSFGISADGSVVEDSTDLTALTDSNNNVTVEAIVYNKIAAFDADIFVTEFDRTISATGHKLVCDKCESYTDEMGLERFKPKYVENCANPDVVKDILENPDNYKDKKFSEVTDFCSGCSCAGVCDGCEMYYEQLKVEKPTIFILKENVAMWYYIIRMLAMAIMLVVLIFIGIKMAISTIASDKAVYKRMFVDWVVGMIMLFTLHYFMIFVVTLNGIAVGIVEKSANEVNKASLQQASQSLGLNLHDELHSKDLEIRVFEEIRSRAYDAKLSNGVIGMVMYMALVFMSIKYTLIYLKRLLTVMVLTLMAPGVGVAYALQKVFTGKSQALKTWMAEFIMNVIIQVIHAIIYAVFISQALLLSLTNIAGMIVALVFLNYASKAQDTFKKIFKFGGKDSLLGHTENALESLKENYATVTGLVAGAPAAAKILTNTPYGKAVKGVGKVAVYGGVFLGRKVANKATKKGSELLYNARVTREKNRISGSAEGEAPLGDALQQQAVENLRARGIINPNSQQSKADRDAIAAKVESANVSAETARQEAENAQSEFDAAEKEFNNLPENATAEQKAAAEKKKADAQERLEQAKNKHSSLEGVANKYRNLSGTIREERAKDYLNKMFDISNYFQFDKGNGASSGPQTLGEKIFGEKEFDPIKMKYVNKGNGLYAQVLSPKKFGLDDKGMKVLKEHGVKPLVDGIVGMGALFIGMGTIITEPKLGMAMLATGASRTGSAFKNVKSIKAEKERYTFSRFSAGAIKQIQQNTKAEAAKQRRQEKAERLQNKRADFVQRFKNGDIRAVTLGLALHPIAPAVLAYKGVNAALHPKDTLKKTGSQVAAMIQHPGATAKNIGNATMNFGKGLVTSSYKEAASFVSNSGRRISNTVKFTTDKTYRGERISSAKNRITSAYNGTISTVKQIGPKTLESGKNFGKNVGRSVGGTFKRVANENAHFASAMDYIRSEQVKLHKQLDHDAEKFTGQQRAAEVAQSINAAQAFFATPGEEERESMAEQGFSYDSSSDKFVRKETIQAADLDESKIKQQPAGSRPSQKVVDDALVKVLEKHIKDGKIDLSSKGLQSTIIKELTTELVASKLIEKDQTVESVFKGGKTELLAVMKGKAAKMSEQRTAESKLQTVLTPDEAAIVKRVTEGSMSGGKSTSVKDILSSIGGEIKASNDGSQRVTFSDAGSVVPKGNSGDLKVAFGDGDIGAKKAEAVKSYVSAIKSTPAPRSYTKRDKKLTQAINAIMPPDPEEVEAKVDTPQVDLGSLLSQIATAEKTATKGGSQTVTFGDVAIQLNEKELGVMKKTVNSLYTAQALNKSAKTYNMTNGTKGFVETEKQRSTLAAEIGRMERDLAYMQQNQSSVVKGSEPNDINRLKAQSAEDISKRIAAKQRAKQKLEADVPFVGPVVDIKNVVKNINTQKTMMPGDRGTKKTRPGGNSGSKGGGNK